MVSKDNDRRPTIQDIPVEYRIRLTGEYNAGITNCVECNEYIGFKYLIGFSDSPIGLLQIHECPKCFTKQYYHLRKLSMLNTYLFLISEGVCSRLTKKP